MGDAGDAEHTLGQTVTIQPDVVLMDLSLRGGRAWKRPGGLAALAPDVRILILTVATADHTVVDAVRAGACGYLRKDTPTEDLIGAIEAAAGGQPRCLATPPPSGSTTCAPTPTIPPRQTRRPI